MMSRGARTTVGSVGVALLAALSCARLGYESLPRDLEAAQGGTDAGTASGGFSGAVLASSSGAAGSSAAGGGSGGSGGSGGLDAGVLDGGSGEALAGCGPAVPTATWSFASDGEGWQIEADLGASGELSWSGASGDPAPGALEIDATVAGGVKNVRVYLDQSPDDLSGKVLYARVFFASGAGVSAKAFVQSGSSAWADGHEISLDAPKWYCISFDPRDADVVTPGFDRTAVHRVGVFFFGDASVRLYVDQVSY